MQLKIGALGRAEALVTDENTAIAAGSGSLPVFATPALAALMEKAACAAVAAALEDGESTVGTSLSIAHTSATPVGLKVWAEATVTEVQGRSITFAVTAGDEAGPIGSGTHQRVCIDGARFLEKCRKKLS